MKSNKRIVLIILLALLLIFIVTGSVLVVVSALNTRSPEDDPEKDDDTGGGSGPQCTSTTNTFDCSSKCPDDPDCAKCCEENIRYACRHSCDEDASDPSLCGSCGKGQLCCVLTTYTKKSCYSLNAEECSTCCGDQGSDGTDGNNVCEDNDDCTRGNVCKDGVCVSAGCVDDVILRKGSTCPGEQPYKAGELPGRFSICFNRSYTGINDVVLIARWYSENNKDRGDITSCDKLTCASGGYDGWTPAGKYDDNNAEICWLLCKKEGGEGRVKDLALVTNCGAPNSTNCPSGYSERGTGFNGHITCGCSTCSENSGMDAKLCAEKGVCAACQFRTSENSCEYGDDCAWCPLPSPTSTYPYNFSSIYGSSVSSEGGACVNTSADPLNCGGCGFNNNGPTSNLCKAGSPFCVNGKCSDRDGASCEDITLPKKGINPYFYYTIKTDGLGGDYSSWCGGESSAVYALSVIDSNEVVCKGVGGEEFLEGLGCCGNNKPRIKRGKMCEVTALCDGHEWHDGSDSSTNGEVFSASGTVFPIANINGVFFKCVDDDKYETFVKNMIKVKEAGGGSTVCVPRSAETQGFCADCSNEGGGIDTSLTGGLAYSCGKDKYDFGGARSISDGCVVHPLHPWDLKDTSVSKDLICTHPFSQGGLYGFAAILEEDYKAINYWYENLGNVYAECPAPITEWIKDDGKVVEPLVVLPCPGRINLDGNDFSDISKAAVLLYGGGNNNRRSVILCKTLREGEEMPVEGDGLPSLGYYRGNATSMGVVEGHEYMCFTDTDAELSEEEESRARIGICCGSQGCEDIPGDINNEFVIKYNPGDYINTSSGYLFCGDNGTWVSDLDNESLQEACSWAGETPTGRYCCAEKDDTSTWINESYNDPGSVTGACFKGTPQYNDEYLFYRGEEYRNVLVHKGVFYGCGFNNSLFVGEYAVAQNPSKLIPIPTGSVVMSMLNSVTGAAVKANELSVCVKECIAEMCYKTSKDKSQCNTFCDADMSKPCSWENDCSALSTTKTINCDENPCKDCYAWCEVASNQCEERCNKSGEIHYVGWECYPPDKKNYLEDCRQCVYPIMHGETGYGGECELFNEVGEGDLCEPDANNRLSLECLQNIEDWPNPGTGCAYTRTSKPLIKAQDYCTMINVSDTLLYCSYNNTWEDSYGQNLSHKSVVPDALMQFFVEQTNNPELVRANCCLPGQCWDPIIGGCVEQLGAGEYYEVDENTIYKCVGGEWINILSEGDRTPDGCDVGFCPEPGQCLYDINGRAEDNNNVSPGAKPQCIADGQYIKDYLCENGTWTSRTKKLALKLASLIDEGASDDFVLMCGKPDEVLVNLENPGATNSYCVLNLKPVRGKVGGGQRIIGTTLNQPFFDDSSGLRDDYLAALEQSFWNVYPASEYPGKDVSFNPDMCESTTRFGSPCIDNDFLKVYYDDEYGMVVFSDKEIKGLTPGLGEQICNALPSWLKWLCPGPSRVEKNFESLTLFNKVYAARVTSGSKRYEVFGVAEERCDYPGAPQEWIYSFNYSGFSSYDLDYLVRDLEAEASITLNQNNVFIKKPAGGLDVWAALTLMRNPEQE